MAEKRSPVWFITGCSTGFGRELAKVVLAAGYDAVVTARDGRRLSDLVVQYPRQVLALDLDLVRPDQIASAAAAARAHFGRVDILVNNAGYGYQCSIEEGTEEEIRAVFEANVFGLFAMTRALLPGMRMQRFGRIINITSIAGVVGFEGSGYYAATKHAIEGWSDSLAAECEPLGIRVTCIEPGRFRTDWAGRSLHRTECLIDDYADTVRARLKATADSDGRQPGDPARAASLILAIGMNPEPPRNVALGERAITMACERLKVKLASIEAYRTRGLEADFPAD